MDGTQSLTRPIVIATPAMLTLSLFLWGKSEFALPSLGADMPQLESKVSSRIAEMNDGVQTSPELVQVEVLNNFVRRLVTNTRDVEPAVVAVINQNFWRLF